MTYKILLISDIHFPVLTPQKSNPFKYKNTIENNFHVNRLMLLADEINKLRPDRVYILGDLLDSTNINLCTREALKTFILKIGVIVNYLNGNHERINQNEYILDYLDIGMKPLHTKQKISKTSITSLNHNQIHDAPHITSDILLSHFRWTLPVFWGTKGELSKTDLSIVTSNYLDVILGDVHAEFEPEDNVTYVNQPYSHKYLPVSPKGLIMLSIKERGYDITRHHLDLPNKILITCSFNELDDVLNTLDERHLYKIRINIKSTEVDALPIPNNRVRFDLVISDLDSEEVIVIERENVLDTLLSVIPEQDRAYIEGILK